MTSTNPTEIFFLLTLALIAVLYFAFSYFKQKKDEEIKWNNGISPFDGSKWSFNGDNAYSVRRYYKDSSGNSLTMHKSKIDYPVWHKATN